MAPAITLDGPVFDVDEDGFWNAENWPGERAPARYWVEGSVGVDLGRGATVIVEYLNAKAELWVPTWLMPAPRDLWWSTTTGIAGNVPIERVFGWAMDAAAELERDRDKAMEEWKTGRTCRPCHGTGEHLPGAAFVAPRRCVACHGTGVTPGWAIVD